MKDETPVVLFRRHETRTPESSPSVWAGEVIAPSKEPDWIGPVMWPVDTYLHIADRLFTTFLESLDDLQTRQNNKGSGAKADITRALRGCMQSMRSKCVDDVKEIEKALDAIVQAKTSVERHKATRSIESADKAKTTCDAVRAQYLAALDADERTRLVRIVNDSFKSALNDENAYVRKNAAYALGLAVAAACGLQVAPSLPSVTEASEKKP